ncbi:hypothetical protein ABZS66_00235 [Dactylosporangium sp. NPDC005572]|uniref:hypothetical protein n=1 Tax=Dactylosporangium sp. NPDC005572 TaxID=3156889 RepID=UPI0033B675BA
MEPVDASPALMAHLGGAPANVDWPGSPRGSAARCPPLPAPGRRGVAGRIRAARLATPGGDPDLVDLAKQVYERMRAAMEERGGLHGPYHPEPDGLMPFAVHDNGSMLCWIPLDADPRTGGRSPSSTPASRRWPTVG